MTGPEATTAAPKSPAFMNTSETGPDHGTRPLNLSGSQLVVLLVLFSDLQTEQSNHCEKREGGGMKTSLGQSPVKRQYAAEGGGMAETVPRHIGRSQRPVQGRNFPHVQCGFTPREEGSLLPPVLTTSNTCHCRNTQSNGSVVPTKRWPCACRAVGGVRFGVFVRVCVCVCV